MWLLTSPLDQNPIVIYYKFNYDFKNHIKIWVDTKGTWVLHLALLFAIAPSISKSDFTLPMVIFFFQHTPYGNYKEQITPYFDLPFEILIETINVPHHPNQN
jgi:hypothetical protein